MTHKFCINCTSNEVVQKFVDLNFCNFIKNFVYNNKITITFLNINTPYLVALTYSGKDFLGIISELC